MGRRSHQPSAPLQPIAPIWPLAEWGMDLIGPFPRAKGNLQYAVVALGYLSKWIEAEPLMTITSKNVQKFFWENIICHFSIHDSSRSTTTHNSTLGLSDNSATTSSSNYASQQFDILSPMGLLNEPTTTFSSA